MSSDSSKKTIFAAIGANLAIAITKFIAATMTGSSAMLSEGIHSLVDTTNQLLLLLGIRLSKKPADDSHPFIQFCKQLSAEDVALAVDRLEEKIKRQHPEVKHIFIEAKSLAASRKSS